MQSGTTELKIELVVDKEIAQNIASVELKQDNEIGTKEAVGSTFWQKLSQKPANYLQHHGVLSKLNLLDFYYLLF
ncbi:hypothetical protein [Arsenophonus endosymbiont of Bemisia tabaci]|uniref:hypothetical protein n=1 Tax=Arsenophonus endosymbiont of Bemisia tabaci TaxID=536059 RepID=UPI0015F7159E|nr:hypothetical protein [Arsenophonus endosymbiont of Bemisia tabaci]CAA2930145.1 hypothetical protein ARSQ2_01267 [Arsenophonus endosymbiont of Bemisia tabaci Q2]